jgi:tRNA pseudouridine55 synthase
MITIEKLESLIQNNIDLSAVLLPVDTVVMHFPKLVLSHDDEIALKQGKVISSSNNLQPAWVRFFNQQDQFFGVGEIVADNKIISRRLISQV